MLIIKMIRKVTGYNQEELAEYLGVSRASINGWENSSNSMSTYQKNIISEKFDIPFEYFDDNIIEDFNKCKELYNLIFNKWNLNNAKRKNNVEDELLNKIEIDFYSNEENQDLSDYEIIEALSCGYDPFTGEIYNDEHILNNIRVKTFLTDVKNKYYKYGVNNLTKDDLNTSQRKLFDEFKKWRYDKAKVEGYYGAYMIFSDKELINIVTSSLDKKEDLLKIKGIAEKKYQKYGDDIYYIYTNGIYDFEVIESL